MKYILIVDQGHRKLTQGKSANGLYEYEFNQDVSERISESFKPYGEVHFTMTTEEHPYSELTSSGRSKNLNYRCDVANNIYNDALKKYGKGNFKCVFVSIHANAFSNPSVSGYEIFVSSKSNERYELAKSIHGASKEIIGVGTSIKDRGIKEASFVVLMKTIMPAALIEFEFYTNLDAVNKLKDNGFRQDCAKSVVVGVCNHFGLEYKEPNPKTEQPRELYRVRKSWEDSKSQIGAYSNLDIAKGIVDANKDYNAYNGQGELVYSAKTVHWAQKHYDNLIDKDIFTEEESVQFDNTITLGEMYKLLDGYTDKKDENKNDVTPEDNIKEDVMVLQFNRALKKGMTGKDVEDLQKALAKIGYTIVCDGSFGGVTDAAVRNFQESNGMKIDGSVGQATVNMINQKLNKKVDSPRQDTEIQPQHNKYEILRPDRQTTVVKIPRANIAKVDVILAKSSSNVETLGSMQKRTGCDFIINGGLYFFEKGKAHSLNLLIDEGKQNNEGTYSRYGLMTYSDGSYTFDWYKWTPNLRDMLGGSPSLIIDGKISIDKGNMSGSLITDRHPRSSVGMDDRYFYLVTIDGRDAKNGLYGMTINELAKFMLSLGCKYAMNNDGGFSTRVMLNGIMLNKCPENRVAHNGVGVFLV